MPLVIHDVTIEAVTRRLERLYRFEREIGYSQGNSEEIDDCEYTLAGLELDLALAESEAA